MKIKPETVELARTVQRVPRLDFIRSVWRYVMGEHVTFIGATQSGKTTLAFQLLDATTSTDLQGVVLVMKPKDDVPATWMKRLGYKRVNTWPPITASRFHPSKPRGWVVWPKLGDIEADDSRLRTVFHAVFRENYSGSAKRKTGGRIIFADEVTGLVDLGGHLPSDLNSTWMRGSSMRLGMWAATQRPFYAPMHAYNAARHLFLHRDDDERNLKRYTEIGGVDPALIWQVVTTQLNLHEFLYIRKTDRTMCIVEA